MKTNAPTAPAQPPPPARPGRAQILQAGALIVVAILAAYAGSFGGPFVFDDLAAIRDNPTIRHLWPLTDVLSPPHGSGTTVGGRPLVNLTLALDYATSGEAVWSYHVTNLAIHVGAALLLFGLVRRTLRRPALAARFGGDATWLAAAAAILWALHPLQTEAVTYVVQRAESLAALFILLTLYCFARSAKPGAGRGWAVGTVGACFLGVLSKETAVVTPLLVLLYDRTFVSGSFREAWRRHRGLLLLLVASWLPLTALALGTGGRGGTAGFNTPLSAWTYPLIQCGSVLHYLRLAFWPHPLVFDYGLGVVPAPLAVAPYALGLAVLLGATVWALVRRPAAGFAAAAFFILLAPSSSVVPVASQPMAEHRLYLPLAGLVVLVLSLAHALIGRRVMMVAGVAALACGAATWSRNLAYRSELALWADTVEHRSENARAHNNLGAALFAAGRAEEAMDHYRTALTLSPRYAEAHNNLGWALAQGGRTAEALPHFEAALREKPDAVEVLANLGSALAATGRLAEAIAMDERAAALDPQAVAPRYNLANARFKAGDFPAAAAAYAEVLRLQPAHNDARFNLAATLLRLNRLPEAVSTYEEILRRVPNDAAAHAELANLLAHLGRTDEAIVHFETALRLQPQFPAAQAALAKLRPARP